MVRWLNTSILRWIDEYIFLLWADGWKRGQTVNSMKLDVSSLFLKDSGLFKPLKWNHKFIISFFRRQPGGFGPYSYLYTLPPLRILVHSRGCRGRYNGVYPLASLGQCCPPPSASLRFGWFYRSRRFGSCLAVLFLCYCHCCQAFYRPADHHRRHHFCCYRLLGEHTLCAYLGTLFMAQKPSQAGPGLHYSYELDQGVFCEI